MFSPRTAARFAGVFAFLAVRSVVGGMALNGSLLSGAGPNSEGAAADDDDG